MSLSRALFYLATWIVNYCGDKTDVRRGYALELDRHEPPPIIFSCDGVCRNFMRSITERPWVPIELLNYFTVPKDGTIVAVMSMPPFLPRGEAGTCSVACKLCSQPPIPVPIDFSQPNETISTEQSTNFFRKSFHIHHTFLAIRHVILLNTSEVHAGTLDHKLIDRRRGSVHHPFFSTCHGRRKGKYCKKSLSNTKCLNRGRYDGPAAGLGRRKMNG